MSGPLAGTQRATLVGGALADDIQGALMSGVGTLFTTNPFWASLAMNPKLNLGTVHPSVAHVVRTAATDGKFSVALSEDFLRDVLRKSQAANQRATLAGITTYVVLHELAHILMDDANPITLDQMPDERLRALAVDYRVFGLLMQDKLSPPSAFETYTLAQAKQGARPSTTRTMVVGDPNIDSIIPDWMDVVAIYRWLQSECKDGASGKGNGDGGEPSLHGDVLPDDGDQGDTPADDDGPQAPAGSSSGPSPSPDAVRAEIMAEAATAAQMMGNMSVTAKRVASAMFRSRTPWERQLRNLVRSAAANAGRQERSFRRLGRWTYVLLGQQLARGGPARAAAFPAYLPGPMAEIVVAVDTSGSIDDVTLGKFAAELTGILASKCVARARVVYCAASCADGGSFYPGRKVELVSPITGGTDFEPVWHWQREHAPDAAAIVYLTDMLGTFGPAKSWPTCPVIWAATTSAGAPFGRIVRLKED